jgi:hypothetical protein
MEVDLRLEQESHWMLPNVDEAAFREAMGEIGESVTQSYLVGSWFWCTP